MIICPFATSSNTNLLKPEMSSEDLWFYFLLGNPTSQYPSLGSYNICRLRSFSLVFTPNRNCICTQSQQIIKSIFPSALSVMLRIPSKAPICSKFFQWDRKLLTLETRLKVEIHWTFHFWEPSPLSNTKRNFLLLPQSTEIAFSDVWFIAIVELDFRCSHHLFLTQIIYREKEQLRIF